MRMKDQAMKRTSLLVAALLSSASLTAPAAKAAGFPEKMITIVVPYPAGSTADAIPRQVAPLITKALGVTVIIENRGGANGSIGAARVAAAPADGYTILLATTGMLAINPWIYDKPPYNAAKDFTPITDGASTPNILVVNP